MKKILLVFFALLLVAIPLAAFAQDEGEEDLSDKLDKLLGQWKRSFASPSYGIAFFTARVEGGDYGVLLDDTRRFMVPAIDLRIMSGKNVSKRGGFYTGVETGVLIFMGGEGQPFNDQQDYYYSDGDNAIPVPGSMSVPLNFNASIDGGIVFLMAKYGLRADIGVSLIGISLGFEMGAGASLFSGGYQFSTSDWVEVGSGSSAATMGLIVDANAEAALRLGKNFRLFVKAGAIIAPIGLPDNQWSEYHWVPEKDDGSPAWDEERQRYLLSQYSLNLNAFAFGARAGFALNFN